MVTRSEITYDTTILQTKIIWTYKDSTFETIILFILPNKGQEIQFCKKTNRKEILIFQAKVVSLLICYNVMSPGCLLLAQ